MYDVSVDLFVFFFFQAEDGIRDYKVTGVQTCAPPISPLSPEELATVSKAITNQFGFQTAFVYSELTLAPNQALERRVDVFGGPKGDQTPGRLPGRFWDKKGLGEGLAGVLGFFGLLPLFLRGGRPGPGG